ncbi:MAG TPA: diacylglycerol kinase family protein [Bacillota bacterium]|nr:diacylglycerol kinase family protein [Bacillota bacterium]
MNGNKKKRTIGFVYAWNGLVEIIKSERNFKIHFTVCIIVLIVNIILNLSAVEWAIILLAIGGVLITETFNTAVERMIDYVKPEIHPSAKHIKDIAAGGVLIAAIISVVTGTIIYFPKLIAFF